MVWDGIPLAHTTGPPKQQSEQSHQRNTQTTCSLLYATRWKCFHIPGWQLMSPPYQDCGHLPATKSCYMFRLSSMQPWTQPHQVVLGTTGQSCPAKSPGRHHPCTVESHSAPGLERRQSIPDQPAHQLNAPQMPGMYSFTWWIHLLLIVSLLEILFFYSHFA